MVIECDGVQYENDYTQYNGSVDRKRVVDDVVTRLHVKGVRMREGANFYWYDDGVFRDKADTRIKEVMLGLLGDNYKINEVREVMCRLSADSRVLVDEQFLDGDVNLINLMNGVYRIRENDFVSHSPDYMLTHRIPVWYDKDATCLDITSLISNILVNEDNIMTMQELFGYCLLRDYRFKHLFFLLGPKDTGKTTMMNILMCMLGTKDMIDGTENVSTVSMHDLCGENPFHRVKLHRKMLNYGDDLTPKPLEDNSLIKSLTGRGRIDAERKHMDSISFVSYAKQVYSCNQFPYIMGDREAFIERIILLMCERVFKPEEQVSNIESILCNKQNMSGLFNWSLEGLYRLLNNGRFTSSKRSDEMKAMCLRQMEPIRGFIEDTIKKDADGFIVMETLYEKYKEWCEDHEAKAFDKAKFYKQFETRVSTAKRGKRRVGGNEPRVFNGVSLIDETKKDSLEPTGEKAQQTLLEHQKKTYDAFGGVNPETGGSLDNPYDEQPKVDNMDMGGNNLSPKRDYGDNQYDLEGM